MSWNIRKNNVNKTVHNRFTKIESFVHFSISVRVAQNSQQLRDKNNVSEPKQSHHLCQFERFCMVHDPRAACLNERRRTCCEQHFGVLSWALAFLKVHCKSHGGFPDKKLRKIQQTGFTWRNYRATNFQKSPLILGLVGHSQSPPQPLVPIPKGTSHLVGWYIMFALQNVFWVVEP